MTDSSVILPPLGDNASFESHLASWPKLPGWLAEAKREAWKRFGELPLPTRREEAWRFASTDGLDLSPFSKTNAADLPEPAAAAPLLPCAGAREFEDGALVRALPLAEELAAKGVLFLPLRTALKSYPAFVKKHLFGHMPELGSAKFEALHAAYLDSGVFVYVPKGVEVSLPLFVRHTAVRPGAALFPHTLVVADENSSVTLAELYESRDASRHFACAASDLVALPGARIRRLMLQNWSDTSLAFHLGSSAADASSLIESTSVHLGGGHVRAEEHGRIVGRGGSVKMRSLAAATGTREIDQRTLQTHSAEDGKSDLLYKNVLTGRARTIFAGLIRVDPCAQRTDAYQSNRNLLLSQEAEASSLPGLEILANDVKCSHGMTTGQLDEAQMYYFLQRGIPRKTAEELMVAGFLGEVLDGMESPELATYALGLLQKRIND